MTTTTTTNTTAEFVRISALTANGREIRELHAPNGTTLYAVQPRNDNYWIACRTEMAALQAFYHPEKYVGPAKRLMNKLGIDHLGM